jgi:hypothetical protein
MFCTAKDTEDVFGEADEVGILASCPAPVSALTRDGLYFEAIHDCPEARHD